MTDNYDKIMKRGVSTRTIALTTAGLLALGFGAAFIKTQRNAEREALLRSGVAAVGQAQTQAMAAVDEAASINQLVAEATHEAAEVGRAAVEKAETEAHRLAREAYWKRFRETKSEFDDTINDLHRAYSAKDFAAVRTYGLAAQKSRMHWGRDVDDIRTVIFAYKRLITAQDDPEEKEALGREAKSFLRDYGRRVRDDVDFSGEPEYSRLLVVEHAWAGIEHALGDEAGALRTLIRGTENAIRSTPYDAERRQERLDGYRKALRELEGR